MFAARPTSLQPQQQCLPHEYSGGVRIKPPRSSFGQTITTAALRKVTLLETGIIVEHVGVRREERQECEGGRREQKRDRARVMKVSRSFVSKGSSL